MMEPRGFLVLAEALSQGTTEAEWRSAISRAYYAAFHMARRLLVQCGFTVPRADRAHAYLFLRLANSSHPDVQKAGGELDSLRGIRNEADYDLAKAMNQSTASMQVRIAGDVIKVLETGFQEPIKTQITNAMRTYERDVLRDVTWHP
jgi:uncharacterized protein (UPF0332 family)